MKKIKTLTMKKGTYINIYVLLAGASHHVKKDNKPADIDTLIRKACTGCTAGCIKESDTKLKITDESICQLFA
jgi:hypothetical protein